VVDNPSSGAISVVVNLISEQERVPGGSKRPALAMSSGVADQDRALLYCFDFLKKGNRRQYQSAAITCAFIIASCLNSYSSKFAIEPAIELTVSLNILLIG
jgi:hypothetical protein